MRYIFLITKNIVVKLKEKNMAIFKGAGVAIVTPMKENREVDYEEYGRMIDYQIENGTDAIITCGTTGESSTLTEEEHMQVVKFAIDHVAKRVPVIAGTGSNCTETAKMMSKDARNMGADALLIVTPYYNKATQKGLYEHYKAIASAVDDTPIIMYNVPSRTGCNIQPETAVALAKDIDNIVAIKAATGNIAQETHTMQLADGCLDMYSGEDGLVVPLMSIGAIGVISVLSNVAPRQTHDMCAEYLAGNVDKAREIQLKALPLVDALFSEVNPIPVKYAMSLLGFKSCTLRAPLTEIEEKNAARLEQAMKDFGLI